MSKKKELQRICREYISKLKGMAKRHGLGDVLANLIEANRREECDATEREVKALSRFCDDERLARSDIPNLLGKSYRQCCEDGDFDKIEMLKRVGIYSKVNALLWKVRSYNLNCKNCNKKNKDLPLKPKED